ncbi:MAG: ParB N-terminal domain-containing protein [Eubacterium sp.]|nr:ParB N-terminal domain-containing protein [Eubacterium sp.]
MSNNAIHEIEIDKLVPFSLHSDSSVYKGDKLKDFMNSIEEIGLLEPIVVRPIDNGKYEIICGHNRVIAVRALGHSVIKADVKEGMSDEQALRSYFDSNLNQQNFADWSYSVKIEAIKYIDKKIRENSQQGKRNDLHKKKVTNEEETTSVYDGQKLDSSSDQSTTRDKMSRRCGIAPSTFSKYRSLIKLPDEMLSSIVQLLDQGKIPFEAAYRVSKLANYNIKYFIESANKNLTPNKKIDMDKLNEIIPKKGTKDEHTVERHLKGAFDEIFVFKNSAMTVKRR